MATNTAVTISAHDSSTDAQSAPPSASNVRNSHSCVVSDPPNSSHPPSRTSSIEEPVTTIPITNTTSPIPITAGITRGRLITRTAISRITPNASAGSRWLSWNSNNWPRLRSFTCIPAAALTPPLNSSHPVPARNPPTTGYGTNRISPPSRNLPITAKTIPQRTVTRMPAVTTVRKTSGGS